MTTANFTLVDVFTDAPLEGNQLGVFTDARGLTTEQMQALARELNFSECTFVLPPESGGHARMRIFTPAEELPFAGHPTLGTAWVLAATLQRDVIDLETGQGIVPVVLERDASGRIVFGRMSQPLPTVERFLHADELLVALGVARSELPVELYDNGVPHVYVCVASAEEVARLEPDMQALTRLGNLGFNCFAVEGHSVKTRVFVPGLGVGEDPATGSAAGPLAVHLARHGRIAWGDEIEIAQGAEIGRPSKLFARAEGGTDGPTQVEVGGSAVIVGRGEFRSWASPLLGTHILTEYYYFAMTFACGGSTFVLYGYQPPRRGEEYPRLICRLGTAGRHLERMCARTVRLDSSVVGSASEGIRPSSAAVLLCATEERPTMEGSPCSR